MLLAVFCVPLQFLVRGCSGDRDYGVLHSINSSAVSFSVYNKELFSGNLLQGDFIFTPALRAYLT